MCAKHIELLRRQNESVGDPQQPISNEEDSS